jgi:purine-binding chemotaxis protein CheW
MSGRIIPVIDLRLRLRLPAKEMNCNDQFLISRTFTRSVALIVDHVIGIREFPGGKIVNTENTLPFAEYLQGVAQLEDGLVLIYNLDHFLSLDEERELDSALQGTKA